MSNKISNFFSIEEALVSEKADKAGVSNAPTEDEKNNIRYTASRMDLFRLFISRPMIVTSWFRNEVVNKLAGGSNTSAHRCGLAVDFYCKGNDLEQVFQSISLSGLSFDQLIYYPKRGIIHIGFRLKKESERQQVMVNNSKGV